MPFFEQGTTYLGEIQGDDVAYLHDSNEAHSLLARRVATVLICPQASLNIDLVTLAHANSPGRPDRIPATIDLVTPPSDPDASADPTGEVNI